MTSPKTPEARQLQRLLEEKLIPWLQNDAPRILLDAPPIGPHVVGLREYSRPVLPPLRPRRKYPHISRWTAQRLNAISVPVLGCIFEGEADYRVHSAPGKPGKEWIVPMTAGTLFAIPPDTPFSDGSKIAWERPAPETAFSRGILIHLRRDGASCHTFTCHHNRLWLHPYIFVYQLEVWLLGAKLMDEMRGEQPGAEYSAPPVAPLYWELILKLLSRSIERNEYSALRTAPESLLGDAPLPPHLLSERVAGATAEYIRTQLNNPRLSSRLVAQHVGFSERHLNRLFEKEMGTSVFSYIQNQRSEKARDLLAHSEISIGEVAEYCGFNSVSVFSSWFSRRSGCSPTEHRHRQRQKKPHRA